MAPRNGIYDIPTFFGFSQNGRICRGSQSSPGSVVGEPEVHFGISEAAGGEWISVDQGHGGQQKQCQGDFGRGMEMGF